MNVTIDDTYASFRAEPEFGRPVTFEVRLRQVDVARGEGWYRRRNLQQRYVVGLLNSGGAGFGHYTSFEKACSAALSRCRRYEAAYSKPRGIQRRPALQAAS